METAEQALLRQVQARLKEMETNAFAVESSAGLPEDAIRSILRGGKKKGTGINIAKTICDALDLEFYIGPRRSDPPPEIVVLDSDDYVAVPRLDVRLSAGPGAFNHDPAEVTRLAFRREWLSRLGVKPADAFLVGISGDSMAPGLRDGDIALVDRGRKTPGKSGQVYALTDIDGSTRVKRIDLVKDGYILRSDAPDYPVEARYRLDMDRTQIEGLVVWSGHNWAV